MGARSLGTRKSTAGGTHVAADPELNIGSGWFHVGATPGESCFECRISMARVLPDLAICRAKDAGLSDYVDCLVEYPSECRHAVGFGWGFLCRSPQRNQIVMRTTMDGQWGSSEAPRPSESQ